MKLGTTRNPKFPRLARRTGLSTRETAGTLELLWLFAMEQAPAGDVGKWSDTDIEEICGWDGEPGALISALVECGWLDECAKHRLLIHDWADHVPEFIRLRIKRGSLTLASREIPATRPVTDQSSTCRRRVGVDREGKGREAEGSQGKGREGGPGEGIQDAPSAPPASRASARRVLVDKPEEFSEESRERLRKWAAKRGIDRNGLNSGLELFRDWVPIKPPYKRTIEAWEGSFQKIVRESVAAGKLGPEAGKPKTTYQRKENGQPVVPGEWSGFPAE